MGLTQGENKNIVLLCKKIEELAHGDITMFELLTNLFYSLRFPNDDEVRTAFISMNFYERVKQYAKFILGKIEEFNSKVAVDFRNKNITIEHIMPQTLSESWKSDLGSDYEAIHKKYLHNIGNLILTEFNIEMGNQTFKEKKQRLATSSLYYRLDVINRDIWNEQSIIEHQSNMINWFLKTFPLPDQYKEKNNWNSQPIEKDTISPLEDINAEDIIEGKKPGELKISDYSITVNSWQAVYLNFLNYVKENYPNGFEAILDNQLKIFGRDELIIKWIKLKELISYDPDLRERYKTLKAQFCYDIPEKELQDDLIFVHTNISASTCVSRIARIMEELYMPEDSVKIKIRNQKKKL